MNSDETKAAETLEPTGGSKEACTSCPDGILVVLCTFPDLAKARETGTALVESQLAACVNLMPAVESIYRWEGKVETAGEVLALFKTTLATWPRFEVRLRELHPYDVPEIVALRPEQVADEYARWVGECVREPAKGGF